MLLFFCLIGFAIAAWNVPAVRNIAAIGSIVTRVNEKMMYLALGRWDMLTTGRYDLWQTVVSHFNRQPMLGKLFGGNVITTLMTDRILVPQGFGLPPNVFAKPFKFWHCGRNYHIFIFGVYVCLSHIPLFHRG